jgi:hypothetical protein
MTVRVPPLPDEDLGLPDPRPIQRDQTEPAADHHACHDFVPGEKTLRVHDCSSNPAV